jgi:hypothetical protein
MARTEFQAIYIDPPALEMSMRPIEERGGAVVMLAAEIDDFLRTNYPEWTEEQRQRATYNLTHQILCRAIEIERQAAGQKGHC